VTTALTPDAKARTFAYVWNVCRSLVLSAATRQREGPEAVLSDEELLARIAQKDPSAMAQSIVLEGNPT